MQRFVIAVAAVLAFAFGTPAFADEPIIIKFSHVVAPDAPKGKAAILFQQLAEKYTNGRSEAYDIHMPYKVPADCYFVMGDNRGNSYDSRFWGCVPRGDILGTPVIIYMSLEAPKDAWNGDIGARFLAYANAIIHPGTIRWRRLFHVF